MPDAGTLLASGGIASAVGGTVGALIQIFGHRGTEKAKASDIIDSLAGEWVERINKQYEKLEHRYEILEHRYENMDMRYRRVEAVIRDIIPALHAEPELAAKLAHAIEDF